MADLESTPGEFSVPPEADFLSYCADGLLLTREVHHREIPGFIYDPQTGFYDQEKEAIDELFTTCKTYMTFEELSLVRKSVALVALVRADQYRDSGQPYLLHDLFIMTQLARAHKLDVTTVVAGGLHDSIEDTQDNPRIQVTASILEQHFGTEVAETVSALTKFEAISKDMANEQLRLKSVLSIFDNVRVAIIKIEDRLHNMLTLGGKNKLAARRTITETQQIYIPLARLLGLSEEAAWLEYLCILHDDREDQERLARISERHARITSNLNETVAVNEMFGQMSMNVTHRESSCTAAAMYRDSEARFYINVDISITKRLQSYGAQWGKDAWKILSPFIWETDRYKVEKEGLISELEFQDLIENSQTDSLSFWVTRTSDGMRFHLHIYPQDVYEREQVPLTYLYRSPRGQEEDFDKIQELAHIKHTVLARRLGRIVESFGSDQASADTLLRELAPRLPDGVMSVVGIDKRGAELVWRMKEKSTALDYARSIAPSNWMKATSVEINGESVPFDSILLPNDKIHIHFGNTRQYDPSWLHSFGTDVGGREELRDAILKQLQEFGGLGRDVVGSIARVATTQMNQYLPPEERPFRYGLLERDIRPLVMKSVDSVRRYLQGTKLEQIITSRSQGDKKIQDLFYFGVGMKLIAGFTLEMIMKKVRKHNQRVRIVKITFSESLKGQVAEVTAKLRDLNINFIGIESDPESPVVRVYLRPADKHREEEIVKGIVLSRRLKKLAYYSIGLATVGDLRDSFLDKKRRHRSI